MLTGRKYYNEPLTSLHFIHFSVIKNNYRMPLNHPLTLSFEFQVFKESIQSSCTLNLIIRNLFSLNFRIKMSTFKLRKIFDWFNKILLESHKLFSFYAQPDNNLLDRTKAFY